MSHSKAWIAGLLCCAVIVIASTAFLIQKSPELSPAETKSEIASALTRADRDDPSPRSSLPVSPVAPPDPRIQNLAEEVSAMREEIAAVARFQSRLEMLMRNLTLKIDGSDLRVRTFEEQQQTIKQWQNELDKQRTQQQMLHSEAQAVARRFGLAPEIVDADDMDILLLPSGRDYSALASAITRLRQAKQILEASEIKISKERLMQTLPPKDSVR